MSEPPVRLCCGTRHYGVLCPVDDHFMCCICFDRFPADEAWRDSDESRWDMCQPCGREQAREAQEA